MKAYRDKVYMVKDIILTLMEHGTLNQTTLVSYCGLNLQKHRPLLDDLVEKGLIGRREIMHGKKRIIEYFVTRKGIEFCRKVLEPYEAVFPRKRR